MSTAQHHEDDRGSIEARKARKARKELRRTRADLVAELASTREMAQQLAGLVEQVESEVQRTSAVIERLSAQAQDSASSFDQRTAGLLRAMESKAQQFEERAAKLTTTLDTRAHDYDQHAAELTTTLDTRAHDYDQHAAELTTTLDTRAHDYDQHVAELTTTLDTRAHDYDQHVAELTALEVQAGTTAEPATGDVETAVEPAHDQVEEITAAVEPDTSNAVESFDATPPGPISVGEDDWSGSPVEPTGTEPVPHLLDGRTETPPAATSALPATRSRIHHAVLARVRPVVMSVTASAFATSFAALARSASDEVLSLGAVHTPRDGTTASFARLTIWNVGGWWEWHDIPAECAPLEPRSAVLRVGDIRSAIDVADRYSSDSKMAIRIDDEVTIGSTLCLPSATNDLLPSSKPRFVERIVLQDVWRGDAVIDTHLGRLHVPSRLATALRSRGPADTDLVIVDGQPRLVCSTPGPTDGVMVTVLAPLGVPGDVVTAPDRRTEGETAVTQLLQSLSSNAAPEELASVACAGVGHAQRIAAAHPRLPADLILSLVRDGTETIRAAAAGNPSIGAEACAIATVDLSPAVRSAVARNPAIDRDQLTALSVDPASEVRAGAAANASASSALLGRLADDAHGLVRMAVAGNAETSAATLERLALDPDPRVCDAVARNPNCATATLEDLVTVVPVAVMANPRTPAALLTAGSRVNDRSIRLALAGNRSTPTARLDALARFDDLELLRIVADNPSTPLGTRRRLRKRLDRAA